MGLLYGGYVCVGREVLLRILSLQIDLLRGRGTNSLVANNTELIR